MEAKSSKQQIKNLQCAHYIRLNKARLYKKGTLFQEGPPKALQLAFGLFYIFLTRSTASSKVA